MSSEVKRAVVPAAGKGTRMEPFSSVVPKELAPIGSTPALHLVIDEAVAAGIEEVGIVTSAGKDLLAAYVDVARRAGHWRQLDVAWIEQPEPEGLGDAIQRCRAFCRGEAFALMLPDNLPVAPDYRLADLIRAATETDLHALAVLELDHSFSDLYGDCGRIRFQPRQDGRLDIERIFDKQPGRLQIEPGSVVRRTCGRYVCQPDVFEEMELVRPGTVGEFDEVPVYQSLASKGRVLGVPIPMPLFDIGHAGGMLAASAFFHGRGTRR